MARFTYTIYGRKDTLWSPDGDMSFRGLDMYHDPSMVAPGYLTVSQNKRLRDGTASTRGGCELPQDFNPGFTNILSGSFVFRNPNGDEVMLVTEENAAFVWALQFGKDPVKITLGDGAGGADPTGTNTSFCAFAQAFDKVILMRRPVGSQPFLVWNGNPDQTAFANNFNPMVIQDPGITFIGTANGWNAEPFENRLIYYSDYFPLLPGRDQLVISDVLNFTAYDQFLATFRVNAGEADFVTRVMGYFRSSLIVFKSRSIHLLQNFELDFLQSSERAITARLGSSGNRMPLMIGSRVMFLSEPGGFFFVDEVIQDQIASDPTPDSLMIQPIIERINWTRQNLWGCSELLGDYSFFGLCLDNLNGGCDSIAVRHNGTGDWHSIDSFGDPNFRIFNLLTTFYAGGTRFNGGERRLFGLDYQNMRVQLMYTGISDDITDGAPVPVADIAQTRGYTGGDPSSFHRFQRAVIGVRTSGPSATVTAVMDGVNEEQDIGVIQKDRLKFYTFAHPPFDPITGDPNEPMREDYSTGTENFAFEDFEELTDGDLPYPYTLPATPIDSSGPKQQSLERMQILKNGRWCSIRITNVGGQCDLLGVGVDSTPIEEGLKVVA